LSTTVLLLSVLLSVILLTNTVKP